MRSIKRIEWFSDWSIWFLFNVLDLDWIHRFDLDLNNYLIWIVFIYLIDWKKESYFIHESCGLRRKVKFYPYVLVMVTSNWKTFSSKIRLKKSKAWFKIGSNHFLPIHSSSELSASRSCLNSKSPSSSIAGAANIRWSTLASKLRKIIVRDAPLWPPAVPTEAYRHQWVVISPEGSIRQCQTLPNRTYMCFVAMINIRKDTSKIINSNCKKFGFQ